MNQQVRFILFVAISAGLLLVWSTFFAPKPGPRPKPAPVAKTEPATPAPGTPAAPEAPAPGAPAAPGAEAEPEVREITVENDLWVARFSTKGAGLVSFELLGDKHKRREDGAEPKQVNLVRAAPGQPAGFALEVGGVDGFGPQAVWEVKEQTKEKLVFQRTRGGLTATKTFTFEPDAYAIGLDVQLSKEGGLPQAGLPVKVQYASFEVPKEGGGGFMGMGGTQEIHQAICRADGTVERHAYDEDEKTLTVSGRPDFAGVDFKYFIAALAPTPAEAPATCVLRSDRPGAFVATIERPATPGADGTARLTFDAYVGPKDDHRLEAFGHGLEESIDYGMFAVVGRPLLWILQAFEKVSGNWGIAIILLTLLVKLLTFPLTHRQMKSMEEMKRLAPKLEEIKTKFSGDQQKINVETMKLYKDHNVQPLAGCVPMLIQMPVWFALYQMLSTSFELYNEPFIHGWISDLTSKDPYYVTPVLMVVTMVLTQLLTPQANTNPQMKYMMYAMPVFFGLIMLSLPAGLVLYIFTNNVLSIGQSLWFRRKFGEPAKVAA